MDKIVRIGTRGSELALWQAHAVAGAISQAFDDITCEIRIFKTQGDINLSVPLSSIGDKGLFTKELETSLLEGTIDMCVHSMKDVLTELPKGCTIAAMLPREDARDALVCGPRMHAHDLASVPAGARLATGSIRRGAFLKSKRPDLIAKGVRGNVETRLKKAQGADYDGAILAVAGLKRLGLDEYISAYIPLEDMIPSPGQAAVGVEIREDDMRMKNICEHIGCATTQACVEAERIVAAGLDGGCH
ncbi:MAG: hydroxymethylbilane synthase, partial [Eggerthellaceae bacterium]|nr:hydroxymethylbilane synthase [Eggerthellaceae bacterium]